VDEQADEDASRSLESKRGSLQAHGSGAAAGAEHHQAQNQQVDSGSEHAQPCSSPGGHAGTVLADRSDIAFVCCLLDRQQQQDIQSTTEAFEGPLTAAQRVISTVDWDQPLQCTRVLDCESTENQLVQDIHVTPRKGSPRLGHRLFARTRPGELRLATVLMSEQ